MIVTVLLLMHCAVLYRFDVFYVAALHMSCIKKCFYNEHNCRGGLKCLWFTDVTCNVQKWP